MNSTVGRLFGVQFLVAVLAAGTVMWFLDRGWFPVIEEAIHRLPPAGELANGRLDWLDEPSMPLAQNGFLGLAVDLFHSGKIGRAAHLQLEFGSEDLRLYSLLGYQVYEYPANFSFHFNQPELEPWWGAWRPMFWIGAGILVVISLMVTWFALATLYCIPVWVVSFLLNRDLGLIQSWRLAGACLMPGALFLTFGIFCYSMQWLDLIHLGGIMALHFIVAWIYIVICPFFLPRVAAAAKASLQHNPFVEAAEVEAKEESPKPQSKPKNPFG